MMTLSIITSVIIIIIIIIIIITSSVQTERSQSLEGNPRT